MSAKRKSKFNPYPHDESATKQLEGVGAYMAPDLVAWFAGMPEAELVANASHWQAPVRFYGCGRQKVMPQQRASVCARGRAPRRSRCMSGNFTPPRPAEIAAFDDRRRRKDRSGQAGRRRWSYSEPFAGRIQGLLESPAFRALSRSAHMALARIELEFIYHGGNLRGGAWRGA